MGRLRKWAALILTAAMIVTSVQTPVWAATDEGTVISEVTEDGAGAEDLTVEEEAFSEDAIVTESVTDPEQPVGADEYDAHIYSEDDFVTALNGKAKNIIIEKSFDLTKSYTIAESTDIQMAGHTIGVDYEGKNPTKASEAISLTIAADKTVNISCDRNRYNCGRGSIVSIINNGTMTIGDTNITNNYGPAMINNGTLTTDNTTLQGLSVSSGDIDINAAVVNNKSYTMSKGTTVNAGNLSGIKNNTGAEFVMEAGIVYITNSSVSNGVSYNGVSNNGTFIQRGGNILSNSSYYRGIGVVNTGTYTLQKGRIYPTYIGVVTYDGGKFEMTGVDAWIEAYSIGVATNAMVNATVSANLNNNKSGSFSIMGGYIDGYVDYAVAYTDVIPQLFGGEVYARIASVANFKDGSFQTLKGIYQNSDDKSVSATYTSGSNKYNSKKIIDGLVWDKPLSEYLSGNKVTSFAELKEAVTGASTDAGKPSYIYVFGNITVSENFAIPAQKQIVLLEDPEQGGTMFIDTDVQLTVESGANLSLRLDTEASVSGNASVVNKGILSIAECYIDGDEDGISTKQTAVVDNSGTLNLYDDIYADSTDRLLGILNNSSGTLNILENGYVYGGTAISNNGICNIDNGYCDWGDYYSVWGDSSDGYGIYNTGTINMNAGKGGIYSAGIGIYQASGKVRLNNIYYVNGGLFGIAYEGSNLPEIGTGTVHGLRYAVAVADKTKPKSEWKSGKYKNLLASGAETDSQGARYIDNGVPYFYTDDLSFSTKYLQMDQGEELVFVEDLLNDPDYVDDEHVIGRDKVTFTSTNDNVIQLSTVSEGDAKYPHPGKKTDRTVAVAGNQKGYTIIKMTTAGGVEDFMRIEVTDKKKADFTVDDFEGHLLDENIGINGYRKENTVRFGFNLKTNKDDVYVQSTVGDLKESTWTPGDIIIHDSEFCDYYTVDFDRDENDTEASEYSFTVEPKLESGIPKVINDKVNSIKDIDVYMTMVSGNGVKAKGMIKIGTMNLSISDVQPNIKFKPITLEGAFDTQSSLNKKDIFSEAYSPQLNSAELSGSVSWCSAVKDLNIDVNNNIVYSGPARKFSTKVPVTCVLDNYYGKYSSEVPVTVTATKPKARLVTSSFSVAKDYAKSANISLSLKSKYEPSLSELKKAEIVGNSNFVISGFAVGNIWKNKKTYQLDNAITLAPKAEVKAETITIKLTYDHVKAVKGKEYATYIKVKVKTPKKFFIKPVTKKRVLDPTPYVGDDGKCYYDDVTFSFKKTPSNYTGAFFAVTDLNGLELVEAPDSATGTFTVRANSKTDTSKPKVITVNWVDDATKAPIATTKVKVAFNTRQSMELKTKKLTMNIAKPAKYYGDFANNRYYYCYYDYDDEEEVIDYGDGDDTKICYRATRDQMMVPLKLKESGTLAYTGGISVSDNRFEVGLWRATQTGKKVWGPYIRPASEALKYNQLVPDTDYTTSITRYDECGNGYTEQITIHIADYKVKSQLTSKDVTLYRKTPYYEATIGVKPTNSAYERIVSITSGDANYGVRKDESTNDVIGYDKDAYSGYQVFYTNHASKNVKDTKPVKVKLTITYASGKTSTEEITVTNVNVKQ